MGVEKLRFLVTGGSGSLGRNIIKKLLSIGATNILSINRDENLIKEAEIEIGPSPVLFKLGDITDRQLVPRLMQGIDIVFHTAALKHVSLAEQNPREVHRVNVVGLLNLLDNSESIKRFVHVSSDKAIGVMNCYGATKLLGEYLVRETNSLYPGNSYIIARCPNFLWSRGSVLDIWMQQLTLNNKINITDPGMTRYFVTLSDAANFIVDLGLDADINPEKIYYPLKYTRKFILKDLAQTFVEMYGNKESKIEVIGSMPGEKKHEDYIKDVKLSSKFFLKKLMKEVVRKIH